MCASLDNLKMLSRLSTGEVFFDAPGARSFEMLSRFIDRIYASLGFSKIIFLDNYDLYNNFIISAKIEGAPDSFYIIDVQNVQKNVASSRGAVFEKNFCDMAFAKTDALTLPLLLTGIAAGFKKLYDCLELDFDTEVFSSETGGSKKELFLTAAGIFKSLSISYEQKSSFELDDFLEIKFYLKNSDHGRLSIGFLAFDRGKILFSLTGGLEKIIKEKCRGGGKMPFVINPFQLVVLTNKIDRAANIFEAVEAVEKKGHSVVWRESGHGEAMRESDFSPLADAYKSAGAYAILVLPDFGDSSKAFLYRGVNQKICGMDFFQLNSVYLQKDFKGCE
ncbi:MAG: hypothetical protein ACD_47C00396G0003 [uncultured bacterium]|uniref:Uncharacterized protein n=1 Tax=Candidatus Wallbacteria bacterium GWC2_49_35 TaxID=1817813 RepID=A0A1F7WUW6_9BACT|nr:MAG: hypothetical protein ACD_47C00396G0003 [uncultured bacterium]OGM05865.1 MAG: hypothetical protein A2008_01690 [Candidatus Wallbacteria bacterium GWC2_49_35]HBC76506.1 hypothetical protein [Candidatus Wallbacteria bacterium]